MSPAYSFPEDLLPTLLAVSLTAINLLRPLYGPDGETITDFALDYLNPAAQRITGLPEQPQGTALGHFPDLATNGVLDFYRRTYAGGLADTFQFNYQADGLDNFFRLSAQRCGAVLVVSFTDTSDQPRTPVENALRASQAAERAARAEAEVQRQRFEEVLTQLPAFIAVYQGPDHIYQFVNPSYQGRFPHRSFLGRPFRKGTPESVELGVVALFDQVYQTGEPFYLPEMAGEFDFHGTGQLEQIFLNLSLHPLRDAQGRIDGVLDFSYDITPQVRARQQVEVLNEELELRVTARSAETKAALFEAEQQREQARQQQARLGQILGQMPAAIATLSGPTHRYAYFNAAYHTISAHRTVLGQTVAETFPELVEQGIIGLLDHVYTSGEPFLGTEILLMLQDPATGQPEPRYLDFTYQPLLDGQQRTEGLLVFALDVTERVRSRKQAETLQTAMLAATKRQAQERENAYQLFEQAPAAVCLLREPDHRITYLNPAYQALFPGQELRSQTLAQVQPDNAALVTLFDGVYQDGETQFQREVPVPVAQADGRPPLLRYFDFTYQAYREEGRIVGVSLFGFDVTERVQAAQDVEAQRAELQRLFAQAPVAIALLRGPDLVIELANVALEGIWGRTAAQVLGQPYFKALPETAGQGFEQILAGVLQTGQPFFVTEAPVQLPRAHTGRPTQGFVNFVFQPLFDEQHHTTGLLAMGMEVTEQVLARQQVQDLNEDLAAINEEMHVTNEELNDANNRLLRTNADLDTFVYTASHDLKAPIANIEGLLLALRHDLPTEVLQGPMVPRLLGMMEHSVKRFQQTIGHLTGIAHLQHTEAVAQVDLRALINGVQLDLRSLLEAAQATFTVEVEDCEALRVAPKTLRSVVYNLLSNAVKYRALDRAPVVQLRAYCGDHELVLSVEDNGLGLSEEQQGELFRLFRRLHTHVEGSGVGLFMVKRLVENAGGTITVESQPGIGTTFTVVLPL